MNRVSNVLRGAMVEAQRHGISLYRIAKACELDDSIIYRFYHNECGLALSSVDRMCQFLGLELVSTSEGLPSPIPRRRPPTPAVKKAARKKKAATKKTAQKKTAKPKKATTKKKSKQAKTKKKTANRKTTKAAKRRK